LGDWYWETAGDDMILRAKKILGEPRIRFLGKKLALS
jgi:hypothetical protein